MIKTLFNTLMGVTVRISEDQINYDFVDSLLRQTVKRNFIRYSFLL